MDLISRQAAIEALYDWELSYTWDEHCKEEYDSPYIISPSKVINNLPSAQPEIVRCKDCKYSHMTYDGDCKYCDIWFPYEQEYMSGDYYCGSAERR